MPLKGGIVALCPYHGHLLYFRRLTILYVQSANVPIQRSTAYRPLVLLAIVSYCSCALEWWDVRTPGAILNVIDFLDYLGSERSERDTLRSVQSKIAIYITRKMVTIKKRAVVIPYIFSSSIALLFHLCFLVVFIF